MDSNRTKLAEDLASVLERDLSGIMENLPTRNIPFEAQQSDILLESDLPSPSCELGKTLMTELLYPNRADIILKVEEESFLCHKEVLMARCEYFKAMLQNTWNERNQDEIMLNNVKPTSVAVLLSFLYGASAELPKFCSILDILQISDMFGISGLTAVVKLHIKIELCHSFHRPCKDCITNAPDVIQLASLFSLTNLFHSCMKWNGEYFYKIWPTRAFASLQADLREKCLKAVVSSIKTKNAVNLLIETDKLLCSITRVQWTKPVLAMATQLMTECCDFIGSNFLKLAENRTIIVLFQGMGWKSDVIERILIDIGNKLTNENVCDAHLAVSRLMYLADKEDWYTEFLTILIQLKKKTWSFLVSNYYAVIHTESWQLVSSNDKMLIKSETLCQGDENRKLTKKPVLSSSLVKKTKTVVPAPPKKITEKKRSTKVKTMVLDTPKNSEVPHGSQEEAEEPPALSPIIAREELLPGEILFDKAVGPKSW